MINNTKKALPQLGISQADVIIELPVEAGHPLLTLFADPRRFPSSLNRSVVMTMLNWSPAGVLVTHVGDPISPTT
jgi:hypothetical protein